MHCRRAARDGQSSCSFEFTSSGICPHRGNRVKPKRQDGQKLRRYWHRWIVERTIAWLHNFRRIATRWDRNLLMYRAFVHVAYLLFTLRQF